MVTLDGQDCYLTPFTRSKQTHQISVWIPLNTKIKKWKRRRLTFVLINSIASGGLWFFEDRVSCNLVKISAQTSIIWRARINCKVGRVQAIVIARLHSVRSLQRADCIDLGNDVEPFTTLVEEILGSLGMVFRLPNLLIVLSILGLTASSSFLGCGLDQFSSAIRKIKKIFEHRVILKLDFRLFNKMLVIVV